jgi:hypothetical protein
MRNLLLFLFLSVINQFFAQNLTEKQYQLIKATITNQFGTVADHFKYNIGFNNICVVGNDTLYNPNGYNYVFQLNNGDAKRLDQSPFHGSNSHRYIFSWEKKLHALGGYGFFTTNNNLSFFIPNLKGWSFKATKNTPPFLLGLCLKKSNKIYSFNNLKGGNSATKDLLDSNLYILDLPSMVWQKYSLNDPELVTIGKVFYLKDYTLHKGETFSLLFKNNSLSFIKLINENIGFSDESELISIEDNVIDLKNNEQRAEKHINYSIDLNHLWNISTNKKNLTWSNIENTTTQFSFFSFLPWILLVVVILLFAVLMIRFYYIKKESVSPYTELHLKFIQHKNNSFTIEELDELLEIEHLEPDSRKLKRTRLINELNNSKPSFIERVRDESDKRRYLYKING